MGLNYPSSSIIASYLSDGFGELDAELLDFARKLEVKEPGGKLEVMSDGWASAKRTSRREPLLREMEDRMRHEVFFASQPPHGMSWRWWFVRLPAGAQIGFHDHHKAFWSGVYYPIGSGAHGELIFEELDVLLRPGCMVTFPGQAGHMVHVTKQERWSLAFNIHP